MPGILMPCSSKLAGTVAAMPDVCLTPQPPPPPRPPAPIPYPNSAQMACAVGAVFQVLIMNKETVAEGAQIPSSTGDEPGVVGGVVSRINRGPAAPKLFSTKVYAGGRKVVFLTSVVACNGPNANMPMGAQVAPSQGKVFVGL
ncbi:MAG: PAAR-like domain-containing protein [Polyangiaceae bacterium]